MTAEWVSDGGAAVIAMNDRTGNDEHDELPTDLRRHVRNGALDESAARRLATRRQVLATLWGLARQAGIEQQLLTRLAG
jgi:hypothetical protein